MAIALRRDFPCRWFATIVIILDHHRRNGNNHHNRSDDLPIIADAVTNAGEKLGGLKRTKVQFLDYVSSASGVQRGSSRFFPHKEMQ